MESRTCPHCNEPLIRTSEEYNIHLDCIIAQDDCEKCRRSFTRRNSRSRPLWVHIRESERSEIRSKAEIASLTDLNKTNQQTTTDADSIQNQ